MIIKNLMFLLTALCPERWIMVAGVCYLLSLDAVPPYPLTGFDNALNICVQTGGTLAMLDTHEKDQFVNSYFTAQSAESKSPEGYWIGLKKEESTGELFFN